MFATKWKHEEKSRHAGNSSRQSKQCRPDRLEFYLDDSCDRLKTSRDGYVLMETEKRQRGNSFVTIRWGGGGGGGEGPFWLLFFIVDFGRKTEAKYSLKSSAFLFGVDAVTLL